MVWRLIRHPFTEIVISVLMLLALAAHVAAR